MRRVFREASRNGKVIFPSWLGPGVGDAPKHLRPRYAFLGGAQVDIGPCADVVLKPGHSGFFFFNIGFLQRLSSQWRGRVFASRHGAFL